MRRFHHAAAGCASSARTKSKYGELWNLGVNRCLPGIWGYAKRMKKQALRLFGLLLILAAAYGQTPATPRERVLFVGNSYTYFNNLPTVLEQFANKVQPGSLEAKM